MALKRSLPLALCAAALAAFSLPAAQAPPGPATRKALRDFDEMKFGMFIHWGLYAIPAGEWKGKYVRGIGEWIMFRERIPVKEYEQLARQFNPVKFNGDEWAQLARDAGMRYLVITSKHHDGFAMFKSNASKYNIVDATPYGKDPMKELSAACARRGIGFGFYYSQDQDWHEAGGRGNDWDFPKERDAQPYLENKVFPQVKEILSNYGKLSLIWFDTPGLLSLEQVTRLRGMVKQLQPSCLLNSRIGHNMGDYTQTADNAIPIQVYTQDGKWEIPATLNDTWGYKKNDNNWKDPRDLIAKLADIASKGGNYLLNVGPTAEGVIPKPSQDILRTIGKWLAVNGESIYGTSPSPFYFPDITWRATVKPGKIYLHILNWPGPKLRLRGLESEVKRAYFLAGKAAAPFTREGNAIDFELPAKPVDRFNSVLVIEIADQTPRVAKAFRAAMDAGRHTVDPVLTNFKSKYAVDWAPFLGRKWTAAADTALPLAEIKRLAERITTVPKNFKLHPLVEKVLADRRAMGEGKMHVDWGMAEHLAFASLVASGYPVRITGQDSGRGTFSHRHAVLHDQNRERWDEGTYIPLQYVSDKQAPFLVIDSVLSEEAVLAFEYGYSSAEPNALVIWEAQFGDFANGAQVVIDQFISSGEVKWGRQSGLTLMLPHGYEGQGPEHSSARIERFLQLSAENNMQVVQPTTAAQIFHLLRRQMIRLLRKPLVIMTPKSLLRHKDAASDLGELARGEFQTVIGERAALDENKVKRVIACSGRVYFDLVAAREERKADDVAVIRIEQLYPFPHKALAAELKKFPNATDVIWCQDEPQNQGAWFYVQHHLLENMSDGQKLGYAGRPASASPAVGYYVKHLEQQKALIDAAFAKLKGVVLNK